LTNALFTSPATIALNCPRPIFMSGICGSVQAAGALGRPPWGSLYYKHLFLLQNSLHNTIDARGVPSMSPTPVVAAAGPAASTPQGAHHRRLQLRWWPLPDLPTAPPRGAAIDISSSGGGRYWTCRQHPPGGHRRLQLRWRPLPDLPPAPPGDQPSTCR
jgi:hypothetical protein